MADLHGGGPENGHHDDVTAWLAEPVQPLLPPQGAFEQIRKRARRRKLRQASVSAASVAVLVAVGLAVPRLVVTHLGPSRITADKGTPRPSAHPAHSTPVTPPSGMAKSHTPVVTPAATATAGPPAPGNFQPSSVTFIGNETGWVIGQAGHPGHCGPPNPNVCTSIVRSDTYGGNWYGVPAPVAGAPSGSHGVGQIRFWNLQYGWAFGPELWATSDGGQNWTRVNTRGMRVTSLETSNGRAFAVWARCGGSLLGLTVGCRDYSLYTATAGSDDWTPVPGATGLSLGSTPDTASLVLTGSTVYLFAPNGELLTGSSNGTGRMTAAASGGAPTHAPCSPSGGPADSEPPGALLTSTGNGLILLCPGTAVGNVQHKVLYYSADGGNTWQREGTAPRAGVATSLAGTPSGGVVLATNAGIEMSARPGAPWQPGGDTALAGGFTYVGMTTDELGVAIPAQTGLHEVWFTDDGGLHWQASRVP